MSANDQWQIFTELDLQGESEQIKLAGFLESMIREFSTINDRKASTQALESADDDFDEDRAEDVYASAAPKTLALSRGSSFLGLESGDLMNYGPLPKGPISPDTAINIIEVYRRGGKLSLKSVKKILRDVYKKLKTVGNVVHASTPEGRGKLHVIGDLHGQLQDLLHIFDDAGNPSPSNKFIFNGDFVDRGPCSVEIIMILFSAYLAYPDAVYLNRGNHEDHVICCQPPPPHGCGGFQRECKDKYDDLTFSMVVEVFRYLPIVHTIDHKVFVVHGGLFGRNGVSIKDIEDIDRLDYNPAPPPEPEPTSPEEERAQDLRQIMRDCLWSDPKASPGVEFNNTRRQGQLFGPNVTAEFLNDNNLLMVVRSHECVKFGFDRPYHDAPHLLATVFSASGYSGSNNLGAYLSFRHSVSPGDKYFKVGEPALLVADSYLDSSSELFFSVNDYSVADATDSLENTNKISLRALILRKRREILAEFEFRDTTKSGKISTGLWGESMCKATSLMINWVDLLPLLDVSFDADGLIDYAQFMSELRANSALLNKADDSESLFNAMYANRATLEVIFNFFDTNGDGTISKSEFRHGCEVLNSKLPTDQRVSDPDALLKMMDIDGNDGIDLNEFFEVFRLVDALDGKMDGQFDILKAT
mmetsp:Transcript_4307/g.5689  ORF Transcript_4307/g.5689 Transcript_4307/m.5689 type:complete len:644 (+) Transcript_4307:76-2007(+)|eukprot:CAMPEP_0114345928 /NCGR_PEP_ID=MMETSP0101-20121206/12656_1 /TAXON_ID=38822 ORGANISM="Pteridomonas danica, Strain PT" /NCGR_SAMPLE_ID=MMETSP0101 /ASSEMBLY_ACC=CAM_ASM_000211 /LENGTH=643 /DNA_ID=CAMNT_0001482259 /DNA_START=63 /DNA_END=1994 /DNA_ORIENTATION=+